MNQRSVRNRHTGHTQQSCYHKLPEFPELTVLEPKPLKCASKILSLYNKVTYGLFSSWQYQSKVQSDLAKTHVLTNFCLQQNDQATNSYFTSGDLDPIDNRFLLVGKSSGGIAIFDVNKVKNGTTFSQVGRIKGGVRGNHSKEVTCVQWYPVDCGLFTSSSSDYCLNVWDPNRMQRVDQFKLDCKIHHHHMSQVASTHSLVAAAGEKGDVVLCDMRSGSSSHRLHGHEEPVHIVQWAKHDPNILASGGKDKTIRMWDVRSGKSCLRILDSENCSEEIHKHRKRMKKLHLAHKSQVTSLCFTNDGLWLISFSLDGCLKVWNTSTGRNMRVKFGRTYTDIKRSLQMSVTYNLQPDLIFVPGKSHVFVYEVTTGALVNSLRGHFSTVLGTIYNPTSGDLYSYGKDQNFLIWRPDKLCPKELEDNIDLFGNSNTVSVPTADCWSDED